MRLCVAMRTQAFIELRRHGRERKPGLNVCLKGIMAIGAMQAILSRTLPSPLLVLTEEESKRFSGSDQEPSSCHTWKKAWMMGNTYLYLFPLHQLNLFSF